MVRLLHWMGPSLMITVVPEVITTSSSTPGTLPPTQVRASPQFPLVPLEEIVFLETAEA